MKLSLPANISRLRKERSMTQEQLAEALGVTFASVSKWERGVSTPELNLIAEMADLFEVSIDALIGYAFRNNDKESTVARLKQYVHDRNGDDALSDVEKALRRYPNYFDVVYHSARIYRIRGLYQKNPAYSKKALALYQRACALIGQNEDPEVSEIAIRNTMAEIHLTLGEYDKGLEILKQNNPCRLNHSVIGHTLASSCGDSESALPYLSIALLDLSASHLRIVMGYAAVYCKTGDYQNALALLDWALAFYPGLRKPGTRSYMDKSEAVLWALRADTLLSMDRKEEAISSLRRAKTVALHFDEAPNYDAANIRFVSYQTPIPIFDDFGDTAILGVDGAIADCGKSKLSELWRRIRNEPNG